ncbi:uncharacterized protein HD556DRAFT_1303504 [Suillus plorans]|uniref:Uncharacterized protein n=1 Tax=Suillus plorans TaxID=116603 RepID=A0A9P7DWU4_9AGAM|nr:uncharacterized protein HD556DRAFT_1303504 [Suillus plorans]KAG1804995.1 hypothetical protein HD556DRAFT_1303504 [Suillus plorans]
MSPGKPAKAIRIKVPRHGAQRIGAKFSAHVAALARKEKIRVATHQPNYDSNNTAQAVESASEWNSLLITARAERGPQWDVGTQQFHVDQGSDLYYNSSPLMEYQKQQREEENAARTSMQPPDFRAHDPSRITRNHSTSSNHNYPYASPGMSQVAPRHPNLGGYSNVPFNGIPPNHFYGPGADGASPARMGMRDSMGASMSPDVRRRSARGMAEDGFIQLHGP